MHVVREIGIDDVTQDQVDMVIRAIRDPMVGGWPLIHWEWVFSESWGGDARESRGVVVIGAWPDSDDRQVTLTFIGHETLDGGFKLADQ